jgi:hypothetical protein
MKGVHNVFYISMLRKCFRDPERQMTLKPVTIEQDLTFEVRPVRILEEVDRVHSSLSRFFGLIKRSEKQHGNLSLRCERNIPSCSRPVSNFVLYKFSRSLLHSESKEFENEFS